MEIINIGSGSKGNCTYIRYKKTKILIDFGITYTTYKSLIDDFKDISGVLITHEHQDHIKGLPKLLGNVDTTIYINKGTYDGMTPKIKDGLINKKIYIIGESFVIDDISIDVINISHDAAEPVGFIIKCGKTKIVYLSDLGVYYQKQEKIIEGADIYLIEANFDPKLLSRSNRPHFLKNRISGLKGHLSNKETGNLLSKVITDNTKEIMLLHLSDECNTEEIALKTIYDTFEENKIKFKGNMFCAKQFAKTEIKIKGENYDRNL